MASTDVEICNLALSRIGANTITSLSANSAKEDRLCNQFYTQFRDELLRSYPWNFAKKAVRLIKTDLYDTSTDYSDAVTITNIATSNPVVVTGTNSFSAGYIIKLWDITGTDELNDLDFEVGAANTATFSLLGVDGGKYTTYSSGGYAVRHEPITIYDEGYTYNLPSDYLKALKLDSGLEFQILGDANGKRLLTTDDDAVLVYTSKVTDVTKFSDDFVQLLVSRIARELVMPILGAKEGIVVRREVTEDFRAANAIARKNHAQEDTILYAFKSTWVNARK